jgi:hypothetical protein
MSQAGAWRSQATTSGLVEQAEQTNVSVVMLTARPLLYLLPLLLVGCDPPQSPAEEVTPTSVEPKKNNDPAAVAVEPYNSKEILFTVYPAPYGLASSMLAWNKVADRSSLPKRLLDTLEESDKVYSIYDRSSPTSNEEASFSSIYNESQNQILVYGNISYTQDFEEFYEISKAEIIELPSIRFRIYESPLLASPPKVWQLSHLKGATLLSQNDLSSYGGGKSRIKWKNNSIVLNLEKLKDSKNYYKISDANIVLKFAKNKLVVERSFSCCIHESTPLVMELGQNSKSHYILVLDLQILDTALSPNLKPLF